MIKWITAWLKRRFITYFSLKWMHWVEISAKFPLILLEIHFIEDLKKSTLKNDWPTCHDSRITSKNHVVQVKLLRRTTLILREPKTLISKESLNKIWSFPLRISAVNVTKSVGNCEFGHIYWRNLYWKTSFFVKTDSL